MTALRTLRDVRDFRADALGMLADRAPPGHIARLHFGPKPAFCVSHLETAAAVLKDPRFIKDARPIGPLKSLPAFSALSAVVGGGLPMMDAGAKARRKALGPVYGGVHRGMASLPGTPWQDRLRALLDAAPKDASDHVDVYPVVAQLVVEQLCTVLFGAAYADVSAALVETIDAGNKALHHLSSRAVPWATTLAQPYAGRVARVRKRLLAFAERAAADMQTRDARFAAADSLDRATYIDEVLTQLVAGTETTSLTICWALMHLGLDPALWRAVQNAPHVDMPALTSTDVTSRVLREALRLYPAFWQTPRVASEALKLDGPNGPISVPQGAFVFLCFYVAHRDPRLFTAPTRFDPTRFDPARLDPARSTPARTDPATPPRSAPVQPAAPLTFGTGPRACIGRRLGFAMMHRVLTHMTRVCTLTPESADMTPHALTFGLKRQAGFRVRARQAQPS